MSRDSENLKLSESGMHEIQHLADPAAQVQYRHLQWVAMGASISHIIAVFLALYAFREGDLQDLSLIHLMDYVPKHLAVWQLSCATIAGSSLSFLALYLALKQVLRLRHTLWVNAATFFIVIAITLDLQTFANLMITFADISAQLVLSSGYKQLLMMEAWRVVNQALTQSMIVSNTLYAMAGLVMAGAIVSGFGVPKWLGWTSIPIWLAGLAASVLTFSGQLSLALVLMFSMTIAFILWTITVAVAVDPYTHSHRFPVEKHPAN
ncbi:MAG: hypothetical protein SGJ27_16530 [Candidatus Melainabacteria bacterium]|mgnify:CR=1 FL=1|nr:hypothetical protein [Candidatus Melainabacteria bacterium]